MKPVDFLIVGGGSAGCVTASRLTRAGAEVVLLEAGPDVPPTCVPADIRDVYPRSYYNASYAWRGLAADQGGDNSGRQSPYVQARILGGGSNLMGMIALRGLPDDYDSWRDHGAAGWGWEDVLPRFRRIETDLDFDDDWHGGSGPITIKRLPEESWPPFAVAVGTAARRLGFGDVADMNGPPADGYGPLPMSMTNQRVSSSSAFLGDDIRRAPNLDVRCNAEVVRLVFEGTRCTGAVVREGTGLARIQASEVILCGGAIHTPTILMRSGIGSARDLARLGISTVVDLPGVGQRLQNHPVVYLAAHLAPHGRQHADVRPGFSTQLRATSGVGDRSSDLQILVLGKSSWHGLGASVAGLGLNLVANDSCGTVRLASSDPSTPPIVKFGFIRSDDDRRRLEIGFELLCDLMRSHEVVELRNESFVAGYSRIVRRLNRPGATNVIVTRTLAGLLDGPDWIRRPMLRWGIAGGDVREDRLTDAAWRDHTARERLFGTYHVAGTCSIGSSSDVMAVVGSDCRVRGVDGLRVVDASIMPLVPRTNTNLPVQMLAERAMDLLLEAQPDAGAPRRPRGRPADE